MNTLRPYLRVAIGIAVLTAPISALAEPTDLRPLGANEAVSALVDRNLRERYWLLLYAEALSMHVMFGQFDSQKANELLVQSATQMAATTDTKLMEQAILEDHKSVAAALFQQLEKQADDAERWPSNQSPEQYRALAKVVLADARQLHTALLERERDPAPALIDANLVYAWLRGSESVPPELNFFTGVPTAVDAVMPNLETLQPPTPPRPQ